MQIRSKSTNLLLLIFFGLFGVHWFYLGRIFRGIVYLLLTPIFSWILWLIDLIRFASMDKKTFDMKYNQLPDYNRAYQQNNPRVRIKKDEYERLLDEAKEIKDDVSTMIRKSQNYNTQIVSDIQEMLKNY